MADYGSLPFEEAIAYLRGKTDVPTDRWDDIAGQAHDHSFIVAGATKANLLADLHADVLAAAEEGISLGEFTKRFEAAVAKHGWTGWTGEDTPEGRAWRARTIYGTNLRTSYAAGRLSQMRAIADRRPYWRYRHNDTVASPRPLHVAWDGTTLKADDPWWRTHYTPNGWGCRCYIETLAAEDLGPAGVSQAPDDGTYEHTDKRTGEVHTLPKGIDYGWDHMPGATRDLVAEVKAQAAKLPPGIRRDLMAEIQPAPLPPARLRTQIKAAATPQEKRQLALDMIDARSTKRPKPVQSHGMAAPEQHLSVTWEGVTFTYAPSGFGREAVADLVVDMADLALPRRLLKHNPRVVFSQQFNKDDAYWEQRYGMSGFRSRATGGDGTTVVYNVPMPAHALAHEAGHAMAQSKYGSTFPPPGSDFGQAVASGEAAPTAYGTGRINEDFADCIRLFFTDRARLRKDAPQRYRVIKRLMEEDGYGG